LERILGDLRRTGPESNRYWTPSDRRGRARAGTALPTRDCGDLALTREDFGPLVEAVGPEAVAFDPVSSEAAETKAATAGVR
jgi:hypothetical protein